MIKQMSPEEAEQLLAQGKILAIDVRDETSFIEKHIEGAVHLSLSGMQEFCSTADKSRPILVYCYHGISSQVIAQHLQDQGFTTVYGLIGGFENWQQHHPTSDQHKE